MTKLKLLDLSYVNFGASGLEHLRPLSRIESLDLSSTSVSAAALHPLSCLPVRRRLSLHHTSIGDELFDLLDRCPVLECVSINDKPFSPEGRIRLAERMGRNRYEHRTDREEREHDLLYG